MTEGKTAVVGGGGYLGSTIAAAAQQQGSSLRLFRSPQTETDVRYDFWRDDIRPHLKDDVGTVVFCARVHPVDEVTNRRRMREFAARARLLGEASSGRLLVLVSTDAVFQGDRGDYREDERPAPTTPYGQCAYVLEQEIMASADKWCVVRPSYIFGFSPVGLDQRLRAAATAASAGQPFSVYPEMVRSPIAVGDVARAVVEIGDRQIEGVIHAGGPAMDLATFFEAGLAALGKPTHSLRRAPAPASSQLNTSLHIKRLFEDTSVVPLDVHTTLLTPTSPQPQ